MTPEIIVAVISGLAALLIAIITRTRLPSRTYRSLVKDIELYNLLPANSKKKRALLTLVDQKVDTYIKITVGYRRNRMDVIMGLIIAAIGGASAWLWITQTETPYQLVSIASLYLVCVGLYYIVRGIRKLDRNYLFKNSK